MPIAIQSNPEASGIGATLEQRQALCPRNIWMPTMPAMVKTNARNPRMVVIAAADYHAAIGGAQPCGALHA
jgi:hypothetical protein